MINRLHLCFAIVMGIAQLTTQLSGEVISVKHKEGTSHGFMVLRSQEGKTLATGDMTQTVEGEHVTTEMVLHFDDGSTYEDTTVFSQNTYFRLISDHVREIGSSFPNPADVHVDAASGIVRVLSEKGSEHKTEEHHLQIPEDAANGMILTLLKNIPSSKAETEVSMVTTSSKPRLVKLKIRTEGKQPFSAGGRPLEATHYVIHMYIGGVAGAVAPLIGKQPPDIHFWIVPGKAPTFVKFTGQLYEGGPIWNLELADVKWKNQPLSNAKH